MAITTLQVASSAADAQQVLSNDSMDLTNAAIRPGAGANKWAIFTFVSPIPAGSAIVSTYMILHMPNSGQDNIGLDITCELIGNSPLAVSVDNNISDRTRTTNVVNWTNTNAASSSNVDVNSPEFVAALQEVVDLGGYAENNNISVIFEGLSGDPNFWSWDRVPDKTNAPRLYVEYTPPVATGIAVPIVLLQHSNRR